MRKLSFYRQERRDRGIRTGIEIDGDVVLHSFEEGEGEPDPSLLWYIDIRCEGDRLPADPEKARRWFLDHAEVIRAGIKLLAEEIGAGVDHGGWPLRWTMPKGPRGVRVEVAVSAVRRLEAMGMAKKLADIAEHWEERLEKLEAVPSHNP
jgi:hypothetical protein